MRNIKPNNSVINLNNSRANLYVTNINIINPNILTKIKHKKKY
jgi:hypothetical protein